MNSSHSSNGSSEHTRSDSVSFHIFYHDRAKLEPVTHGIESDERFNFVDLNTVPLPGFLRITELDEHKNRALFSEYLGLLSVQPSTNLVGFFTYSIPLKFSAEWATYTGHAEIFLPEITFPKIAAGHFEQEFLYAVELSNPLHRFPKEILEIHNLYRVGGRQLSKLGPFKSSFIVSADRFDGFIPWFKTVCCHVTQTVDWRIKTGDNSRFSVSPLANKTESELSIDKIRHGLGGILERAVAYYFAQCFQDEKKHRLGRYLADSVR